MIKIAPSILSADFAEMGKHVKRMEEAGADYIHCDVMDGVFVPNITFGFQMIKDIKKLTKLPLDVHLMIDKPEKYVQRFYEAGADIITVHAEATNQLHRTITDINSFGIKSGVVLNPGTPLEAAEYVLPDVDMVLLMSVDPGFGGQKFIPQLLDKTRRLKKMIDERRLNVDIEIDGGINDETVDAAIEAGANVLVAGSAVFSASDPKSAIERLRGIK